MANKEVKFMVWRESKNEFLLSGNFRIIRRNFSKKYNVSYNTIDKWLSPFVKEKYIKKSQECTSLGGGKDAPTFEAVYTLLNKEYLELDKKTMLEIYEKHASK